MKKDITETIEFFIPTQGLDVQTYIDQVLPEDASPKQRRLRKQAIHHIGRYNWASLVLGTTPPGQILDVACGSGYGSYILAQSLPGHTIIGADYDERAVETARKHYGDLPNLSFRQMDLETWRFTDDESKVGPVDYITSFDTIEHLLHREIALINIAENLRSDGMLLLSTPCGKKENLLNPGWEHHKIEYGYAYLYNLMRRFFRRVLVPDGELFPHRQFWDDVINRDEQRYLLRANPMICQIPAALGLEWQI